jgi:hypothetical protein
VFTTNMTGNLLFLGFALALSRRSNGFLILVEEIHRSSRRCPSAQRI